jgi:hypothetical protein
MIKSPVPAEYSVCLILLVLTSGRTRRSATLLADLIWPEPKILAGNRARNTPKASRNWPRHGPGNRVVGISDADEI